MSKKLTMSEMKAIAFTVLKQVEVINDKFNKTIEENPAYKKAVQKLIVKFGINDLNNDIEALKAKYKGYTFSFGEIGPYTKSFGHAKNELTNKFRKTTYGGNYPGSIFHTASQKIVNKMILDQINSEIDIDKLIKTLVAKLTK